MKGLWSPSWWGGAQTRRNSFQKNSVTGGKSLEEWGFQISHLNPRPTTVFLPYSYFRNRSKYLILNWVKSNSNALKCFGRASLVAQWLRICLPMQSTRVRALVWEDPTCRRATRPVSHNCWACASGACAPQQERPQQWEARAPRWRVAPACRN